MTLSAVKKRIQPGTKLTLVGHSTRPESIGEVRTVTRVQGNGFYWTRDGDPREVWTAFPKAESAIVSNDQFQFFHGQGMHVTLKFGV